MKEKSYVKPCSLNMNAKGTAAVPFMLGYAAGVAAKAAIVGGASAAGAAVVSKMAGDHSLRVELDGTSLAVG